MTNVKRASVSLTDNFEANLARIEAFWDDNHFSLGYDRLLDELTDTVIPNLERHPRLGRPFAKRHPQTVQAQEKLQAVNAQLAKLSMNAELREYVLSDYTALYALVENNIYLLAIKHQKQLAFDVGRA